MLIKVSIAEQTLSLFSGADTSLPPILHYSISTALKGVGCVKNSGQTPLGKHIIRAKIGQDEPFNTVFVGRRPTGEIYCDALSNEHPSRDWILSRIMWLSGTEIGQNRLGQVDSMQRYIYIHGTPDSEPMGIALSHGCIRMRNTDVVALFDQVKVGTPVVIET